MSGQYDYSKLENVTVYKIHQNINSTRKVHWYMPHFSGSDIKLNIKQYTPELWSKVMVDLASPSLIHLLCY